MFRRADYLTALAVASIVALVSCNRFTDTADKMNNDKSDSFQHESDDEPFVLGQQLADAHDAETKWKELGGGSSPLPETEYDFWRGDLSLIRPTPNDLDGEIRDVCRKYALLNADERSEIRHSIRMDQFYTLMNFAKRSAVFGLRDSNANLVFDGLIAVAMIEQDRVDFRDILMTLGIMHHAVNRAGGNADEMFRAAAKMAQPEVAKFFVNFTTQSRKYRGLRESWGYDEVETSDGVGFIGWGFRDYDPSVDLKSTIIDISQLIASDHYQPSQIQVATELPDFWLGGQKNPASKRAFSGIRGGASVSASLHPDKHDENESQQFAVFLVETANESDAQTLFQMAEAHKSTKHCKLALARSRLFCLVVARSFVVGVDSYETNESLMRFSDRLSAVLERHAKVDEAKK